MRGMRYLGGLVVSDFRREGRHQHQVVLHVLVHLGAIDLNAFEHVFDIAVAGVGDECD